MPRLGKQVLKKEHPLSSGIQRFAAKLAVKFVGPFVMHKTLFIVVFQLHRLVERKTLTVHVKDLKPL